MFKISDRHQPTWELMAQYFTFTPNSRDLRNFQMDMRTLHPPMLRDAILECIGANEENRIHYAEQRHFIHKAYTRKVKEFAAVYPFVFAVENALRSAVADHLEETIGRMDWWVIIRDAVIKGTSPDHFNDSSVKSHENPRSIIYGTKVATAFLKYVYHVMEVLLGNSTIAERILGANKSDEFYYCLSLGELWLMVDKGWSAMRPMFCPDEYLGFKLTRKIFNDELRSVKEARNQLYHSNPIDNRFGVIECAEKILNILDFHLGDYDAALASTHYVRHVPIISRTKRHALPG